MNWQFTTNWMSGFCSIDNGPCEYQVVLRHQIDTPLFLADHENVIPPNVTFVESVMRERLRAIGATTGEGLLRHLCNPPKHMPFVPWAHFVVAVRCRSDKHGVLECQL